MRDILIVSIVLIAAFMALRRPWIGVMLWLWISIMNPHRYAYGFSATAPIAMIAAASTLLGLLFTRERQSPFKGAPAWWLFAFTVIVTLSWLLGYDLAGDYPMWDKVMKIYLMTFVALALLNNKYHIMAFVWVTTFSLALLGAKGGLFTVLTGGNYRVWGPEGSFIGGNNEMALALVIIIPIIYFLQLQLRQTWAKYTMTLTIILCAIAAIGSYSRGAFLAISAMGLMFWWRSQKKLFLMLVILFMVIIMLPMMPEQWWDRMDTIQTYDEDASAIGRLNGWIVAWEVAKLYFFGGGMSYQHQSIFDIYGYYNHDVIAAHSIYFQILGNHGFIGLALFLLLWISTYRTANWLRKNARKIPEAKWTADLGAMVQVGLVGYAVGGAFLSLAYFDLPYNLMVSVVLAKHWVLTQGWEHDPKVTFLEYAGLQRKSSIMKKEQFKPGNSKS